MGDRHNDPLRVDFDRQIKLESSDGRERAALIIVQSHLPRCLTSWNQPQ
jgi:hypothetical protein